MTLQDKQVDHLILLVGGNPLPNAVAGRLLVKPGGVTSLIFSRDSKSVADSLQEWLVDVVRVAPTEPVDESRSRSIMNEVTRSLDKQAGSSSIGLNYTGGTKAMAVHAYRAAEIWAIQNKHNISYSYLDVRTNKFVFDNSPEEFYVGDQLVFELDDFLSLHRWQLKCNPRTTPILEDTARAIAHTYAHHGQDDGQPYKEWKTKVVLPKCKSGGKWLRNHDLREIKLDWPTGKSLDPVTQALKRETGQINNAQLDIVAARKSLGLSDEQEFCKWLDGFWLEHYLLDVLLHLPDEARHDRDTSKLHHLVYQSVRIQTDKTGDFELDVAAIFGYQLFGFSCGTATGPSAKGELKLKLFEAITRTRQLSGDQAPSALLCAYEDPDMIQAEARQQLDSGEQIKVFGCRDLDGLEEKLASWIRSQRKQP